jgi:leucyl aminopeptidase
MPLKLQCLEWGALRGQATPAPLTAVAVPKQTAKALPAALLGWDEASAGVLGRLFTSGDFTGARDEVASAYLAGVGRMLLIGTGKSEADTARAQVRRAAAIAARRGNAAGSGTLVFGMPAAFRPALAVADYAQVAAEGLGQGAWAFRDLKTQNGEQKPLLDAATVALDDGEAAAAAPGFRIGAAIAAGQALTRHLQFLPPNQCTPTFLAETAQELASRHGFTLTVLDRERMRQEGMGALLAVAQGSTTEPRFIVLEYKGKGDAAPVGLVGKGITFDTGGISIKPAAKMEDMKYDMSGAAAVLGAMEAIGTIRPAVNVVAVVPSCDNMPGGNAIRPADVVRSHFGKSIEIVNTDAEGRLILADALSYIRRFQPAAVLDAATLTGAATYVTGDQAAPIMGNDEALISEVRAASERSGERVWPLPMYEEYRDLNKSDIADVKNSGGPKAGTISAGWFLREFVEGYAWVHLDVAGTAYTDSDTPPLPKGPAGVPMRTFVEWVLARAG